MKAFSKDVTKEQLVASLKEHYMLDNFTQGFYFEEGKGCGVGCAIESINKLTGSDIDHSDHEGLAASLDVPKSLFYFLDKIFEGLSVDESKEWPLNFTKAINEGSDLSAIETPLLVFIIESTFECYDNVKFANVRKDQEDAINALLLNDKDLLLKSRNDSIDAIDAIEDGDFAGFAASDADFDADAYAAAYAVYASANDASDADFDADAANDASDAADAAYAVYTDANDAATVYAAYVNSVYADFDANAYAAAYAVYASANDASDADFGDVAYAYAATAYATSIAADFDGVAYACAAYAAYVYATADVKHHCWKKLSVKIVELIKECK